MPDPTPEDYERARAALDGWVWSVDGSDPIRAVARAIAAARAEERELSAQTVETLIHLKRRADDWETTLNRWSRDAAAAIRDRAKQEQES